MTGTKRVWALSGLQVFTGIGALGGGWVLWRDPSGAVMGLSVGMLLGSPFRDYRLPGLVLFLLVGVGHLMAATSGLAGWRYAGVLGAAVGLWLECFIVGEWFWVSEQSWLQPVFFTLGALEIALCLAGRPKAKPSGTYLQAI